MNVGKNLLRPTIRLKKSRKNHASILVINVGSSSIKFGVYSDGNSLELILRGTLHKQHGNAALLNVDRGNGVKEEEHIAASSIERTPPSVFLLQWLEKQECFGSIKSVGHRVVHGMHHTDAQRVSPSLISELRNISNFIPDHLPKELEMIEAISWRHPTLTQVVCFDTAFHRAMPRVAKILPIPRRLTENGVQRYGFHGLSYAYLMQELHHLSQSIASERVILTHLGSGCSMTAVLNGKCIDTSMCFTPAAGLPMGTRSGDLDPGLICYLLSSEKMSAAQLRHMINYESGLLGVSETSADMRTLLDTEQNDARSAEAIAMFCYHVKKWIGSYTAALGGLDTLVFTGGIGEHAPNIRTRICEGFKYLGMSLDEKRNTENAPVISTNTSGVKVRVIPTNEELMIARSVSEMLPTRRSQSRETQWATYE